MDYGGTGVVASGLLETLRGDSQLQDGSQIVNSGTFTVENGSPLDFNAIGNLGAAFVNTGVLTEAATVSNATVNFNIALDNCRTVQIPTGSIGLFGGGVSSGNFDFAAGTGLGFGDGVVLTSSSVVCGAGTVEFFGSPTISGTYDVDPHSGATIHYSGFPDLSAANVVSVGSDLQVDAIGFGNYSINFGSANFTVQTLTDYFGTLIAGNVDVTNKFTWLGELPG